MERRTFLTGLAALGASGLAACSADDPAPSPSATTPSSTPSSTPTSAATTERPPRPKIAGEIATGLNVPWGIAFLDDGSALVGQRDDGTILRVTSGGDVTPVGEVPGVEPGGAGGSEGGLLGLAIDPDDSSSLYAYLSTAQDDRLVRMSYRDGRLGTPQRLLTGVPSRVHHHGGRLLFDGEALYLSIGDAEDSATAQDRDALTGKVLRLGRDGKALRGNPFGNRTWTYGHRNVEGLALDSSGRLWATEFGDKKADELNLLVAGRNYGWPEVEGRGSGYSDPKATWGTSECSPAGLAITRSTAFVGALQGRCLFAVPLDGTSAGTPVAHFGEEHGRIRSVAAAPDGSLWITTSNTDGRTTPGAGDDRILRVTL